MNYARAQSNPLRRSALIRWVIDRYWTRLTTPGRAVLSGVIVSMILGASSMDVPIYLVWCGAVALLIASALMSMMFHPNVEAFRQLPKHVRAGEKLRYNLRLVNLSTRHCRQIEVEEIGLPKELKPFAQNETKLKLLSRGAKHEFTLGLDCLKRGVYILPSVAVSSTYPSGLVKARRRAGSEQQLMVYPYFRRLSDFQLPSGRRYQPGGLAMTSDVGDSTEFLCTREYRYGDSIRNIHWSSWARTGKPIVKVFQEEYFVRLAMLLDSEVHGESDRAFESGISLAASVADVLSRQEYIIDIFAAGEKIYRFQAGRSLAHFDNILQILACITHTPKVDMEVVFNTLAPEANRLSALICIMMDWDEKRRSLVRHLKSIGLATKTIIIKETSPTISIAGEAEVFWWRPDEVMEAFS